MRTSERMLRVLLLGGLLAAAPAHALDGSKTDGTVGPPPMTPMEAFRSGANWLKAGETVKAVAYVALKTAAGLRPTREYLGHLLAGRDLLPQKYWEWLLATPTFD